MVDPKTLPPVRKRTTRRAYSRQTREAATLLGQLIRAARIEKQLSVQELADRVGVSRDLMQRLERGDPRCSLGVAFEAAVIIGVPLFFEDPSRFAAERAHLEEKLRLLPKTVRKTTKGVRDDF